MSQYPISPLQNIEAERLAYTPEWVARSAALIPPPKAEGPGIVARLNPISGFNRGQLAGAPGAIAASTRQSWPALVARKLARPSGMSRIDPDFNPFTRILESPLYKNDPRVLMLAEMGQFDEAYNQQAFDQYLLEGLQEFDDLDRVQESTWGQFGLAMAIEMVGDPTNLIPVGAAVKAPVAVGRRGAARHIGQIAALGGGFSLADQQVRSALSVTQRVEGPLDEFAALGVGLAFGGGIGALTTPAALQQGQRVLSTQRVRQMQESLAEAFAAPIARSDADLGMGAAPGGTGALIPEQTSLFAEYQRSEQQLARMLEQDAVRDSVVSPIYRPGDANHVALEQLQAKYDEAGVPLIVQRNPYQDRYDLLANVQDMLNVVRSEAAAGAADLDANRLDRAAMTATETWTQMQRFLTPGGRLQDNPVDMLDAMYRTLSASTGTFTASQAAHPVTARSGADAESIRHLFYQQQQEASLTQRAAWISARREARKSGEPIVHDGLPITNEAEFYDAVSQLAFAENDRARGLDVVVPEQVHPAIRAAAEAERTYYAKMADTMEQAGMLDVGPRALRSAKDEFDRIEAARITIQDQLDNLSQIAAEDPRMFPATFGQKDVESRLSVYAPEIDIFEAAAAILDGDETASVRLALHPDAISHLSPLERGRVAQKIEINAMADDGTEIERLTGFSVDDFINAALGGRRGQLSAAVNDVLGAPEGFTPDVVLDALLWKYADESRRGRGPAIPAGSRVLINPAQLPDGATVDVMGREFTARTVDGRKTLVGEDYELDAVDLGRLPVLESSIDGLGLATDAATGNRLSRAERLERQAKKLQDKAAKAEARVAALEKAVHEQRFYTPHVFDVPRIREDGETFIQALADSFRKRHSMRDGRRLADDERDLLPEVLEQARIDKGAIAAAKAAREGNPPPGIDPPAGLGDQPRPFVVPFRERATPRWGRVTLAFESDLDRVAYIVRNGATRSRRDQDYLDALMAYTGLDEAAVRSLGDNVARSIKELGIKTSDTGQRRIAAGAAKLDQAGVDTTPPLSQLVDGLTEADLPEDLRRRYRETLDTYFRSNAETVHRRLTSDVKERHGVLEGTKQDPTQRRTMEFVESDMAPYLVRDGQERLERYHRVVGGRLAVRRAIQLNPDLWSNFKDYKGRPVNIETGDDLYNAVAGRIDQFIRVAADLDRQRGTGHDLARTGETLKKQLEQSLRTPLDRLEGRTLGIEGHEFLQFMGRTLGRNAFMTKLGSTLWSQLGDLAPSTLHMMQRGRGLPRLIKSLASKTTRRDQQLLGIGIDGLLRTRALADTDHVMLREGFGPATSRRRRLSARFERFQTRATDAFSVATGLRGFTNLSKQLSGVLVVDKATHLAKRMRRAGELMAGGMDEPAALRKAGISRYEAARLNKMGFNAERSGYWLRQTYAHGLDVDDNPVRTKMTWSEFLESKDVVKNNFDEWDIRTDADRDVFDTLTAGITREVNYNQVVTPGEFDRPLLNDHPIGRLFNQFQSFAMAFTNQRLRTMGQMPAHYQAWYLMSYLALGAMSDAIANSLSQRRSLADTAEMWATNPMGMTYAAFERSGMMGWLSRVVPVTDKMGVPFSPGNLLGNTVGSTAGRSATRAFQPAQAVIAAAGPVATDLVRMADIAGDVGSGGIDDRTAYNAGKLMWFQNWVALRALHSATGAPVIPEAIYVPERNR